MKLPSEFNSPNFVDILWVLDYLLGLNYMNFLGRCFGRDFVSSSLFLLLPLR
jgi:hypothetical protein